MLSMSVIGERGGGLSHPHRVSDSEKERAGLPVDKSDTVSVKRYGYCYVNVFVFDSLFILLVVTLHLAMFLFL